MAFLLGALIAIPTITYGVNELSNTLDDIVNFDYNKYICDSISNMNLGSQIIFLELELKNNTQKYNNYNQEYLKLFKNNNFFDKELANSIKIKRNHHEKLCIEIKKQIKDKKSKLN